MLQAHREKLTALSLAVVAFAYYYLLCAKSWTWMFASFDSGDWLAASQIWMTPQPYGSPLYILLGHFLELFPGDLVIKMTVVLSVLPASITVGLVYLIVKKLGYENKYAILSSFVLLACGIFLSQATVLEEYAIATMFVTLAFYLYVSGYRKLVLLSLALGTAIHIIVLPITFVWMCVHYKEWRAWVKPVGLYLAVGALFYSTILWLMALDTPNIIAGDLSIQSINAYLGSTGTIGRISMHETPERILQAGSVILLGFGVTLIPLVHGLRKPWDNILKVIFITVLLCVWLYITNTDMTTWTFMVFSIPLACIAIGIGLSKLPKWCSIVVIAWVFVAMCCNAIWLNADTLSRQNNEPDKFYTATMQIPDSSAMLCNKGGAYGMAVMYAISSGKEITPLFLQRDDGCNNQGYQDYLSWIQNHHKTEGNNWNEQTEYCLSIGREIYMPYYTLPPEWQEDIDEFCESEHYNEYYRKITGIY